MLYQNSAARQSDTWQDKADQHSRPVTRFDRDIAVLLNATDDLAAFSGSLAVLQSAVQRHFSIEADRIASTRGEGAANDYRTDHDHLVRALNDAKRFGCGPQSSPQSRRSLAQVMARWLKSELNVRSRRGDLAY